MPTGQVLRPHQVEAVDSVLRALGTPADGLLPAEGLRCQCIAATGSGKTLIAAATARKLGARRVLVLVPTLSLLVQTAAAWRRDGGRSGAMIGACSLPASESQGVPCTTDVGDLVAWTRGLDMVTVFGTYASVGVLERAHAAGLAAWDLVVVDEAHRTSGDGLKPWAAVHDQQRVPAGRRLYMTATPRMWEAAEGRGGGEGLRLVASMSEDSPVFGPVAYRLTLSEAIGRGLVAPYQVVCVDIRDPEYGRRAQLGSGVDGVRGGRLAALQAGVLTAAARERVRKLLTFHSRVVEAEAMAEGVVGVAARLWEADPRTYPDPKRVWASWLHGGHAPARRQAVLEEFASGVIEHPVSGVGGGVCAGVGRELLPAALRVLSSVKVLGEGVDTVADAIAFGDVRGSMVDIVQMVGRALRMQPGQGKIASLIVPVFLEEDEDPEDMLTSETYGGLAKILEALRAHDADTIEALADSRPRSGSWTGEEAGAVDTGESADGFGDGVGGRDGGGPVDLVSAGARELLKFSSPRDPALLARFVRLRVLEPEGAYWRRGVEAAARYVQETGSAQLRVPYDYVTPGQWSPAGFALGTWLATQRKTRRAGRLEGERVAELDALGMVWSHQDLAFEEGLAAAREWARVHGHFLPPVGAVWNGYPVGSWAKNQRAAAKLADQFEARREASESVGSAAGALSPSRREALEEIDGGWCPVWDVGWQRCFRLVQARLRDGGAVPMVAGEVVVQGEDLGRWVTAQRDGWDQLSTAQVWLLGHVLGLEPIGEGELPVRRTQDHKWRLNLAAARQYRSREGHLNVPRKHVEEVPVDEAGPAATGRETTPEGTVPVALGQWVSNTRRRADTLTEQRRTELDELGMRW
ncbi:Helicase associated domain protein [Streptomyces sp. BH106]|uniref:helicase associated domain-containing protein n=1 Tax=Streptomyces sp. BH106 TaxID=3410409 RepID=UPI003CFADF17